MPHWPQPAQWADHAITVPLEDLASCIMHIGERARLGHTEIAPLTVAMVLDQWNDYGSRLDAYILPQPDGSFLAGVRYGAAGPEYLSVYCDQEKLRSLAESVAAQAITSPAP